MEKGYILFLIDGDCTLCNRLIVWILNRRKTDNIRFFTLQSQHSINFLNTVGLGDAELMNTSYLVTPGGVFEKSRAFFMLSAYLRRRYSLLRIFSFIPTRATDFFYDLIARNRYRLFGKEYVFCDYSLRHYSHFILTEDEASLFFEEIRKTYVKDQQA